ncbi:MAG: hypothetical protein QW343_01390 [Candidatus Norongarragalinales archaeon]
MNYSLLFSAAVFYFLLSFSLPAAAQSLESDSSACTNEDVCILPALEPPAWFLALQSGETPPAPATASGAAATVRDVVEAARTMPSYSDSSLRSSAWCKGLENNNIREYNLVSGQPLLSWEEVIMRVVNQPEIKRLGVKPEYLCVLLWMESRGNAFDVGADGECGAFQTMPQFYENYGEYCARWSREYAFVAKTCKREQWDNYAFHAYPNAELGFNDPKSCFHPLNSAFAGALEFGRKLKASSNIREAFRRYNGSGPKAEAYADKAWSRLQKIYDSRVA